MKICFIQRGNPCFLEIAAAQAASVGLHPVIIGDELSKNLSFEHIDIEDFNGACVEFRKNYVHRGVNPHQFESFCYERWFVLEEYARQVQEEILMADHDILLYPKIQSILSMLRMVNKSRLCLLDSAWLCYMPSACAINIVTSYFMRVFSSELESERLAEKHAIAGIPHLSDMHLLLELSQERKEEFIPVAHFGMEIGLDNNIRATDGYKAENLHKKILWQNNIPYVQNLHGNCLEMASLHFQGPSKFLMDMYHTVESNNNTSVLPQFVSQVEALPTDKLGESIKSLRATLARSRI